jgi:hypothetical protein
MINKKKSPAFWDNTPSPPPNEISPSATVNDNLNIMLCDIPAGADITRDATDANFIFISPDVYIAIDQPLLQVMLIASYLLSLEAGHKLSQKGINDVISTTEQLLNHQIVSCMQQFERCPGNSLNVRSVNVILPYVT